MPIVDDTSITEILSGDDVVSEIANAPHDELKVIIDEINTHHDSDLVHSGDLTISGDGDIILEGESLSELVSGGDTTLHSHSIVAPHTVASHSDTTATGAELNTLTGGGDTTLHSHGGRDIKAWVNFDGTGSFPSGINDSYNVASIVDEGVGDYTINWDTNFANANYAIVATNSDSDAAITSHIESVAPPTVGGCRIVTTQPTVGNKDSDIVCLIAIGDQ